MIKKLKWQFVMTNMVLVLFVIVPVFFYMQYSLKRSLEMDSFVAIDEGFRQFGLKTSQKGEQPPNDKVFKPIDFNNAGAGESPYSRHFFSTFYVVVDENKNIVKTYSRSDFELTEDDLGQIVDRVYETDVVRGELKDLGLRFIVKPYTDENGEELTAIGLMDISFEKNFLSDQSSLFFMIFFVLLIVFFIISIYLSNMIIKPIEKSWKQQQQFISDASHELKTPTAVILANTSILAMSQNLGEDKKWVDYIELEAKRMKKLVEDLLFLSKSDYTKVKQILSTCNLSDIVLNTILPFEAVIFEKQKKVDINLDIDSDITVLGDENQLKQLVMIIADNAYKYCYDNTAISISLKSSESKGMAVLKINNMADEIPKEDLDHLFDRFYRVDKARARNNESYGLGLAIAQEIVNGHKGKISVSSDNNNGTTFKISLPLLSK